MLYVLLLIECHAEHIQKEALSKKGPLLSGHRTLLYDQKKEVHKLLLSGPRPLFSHPRLLFSDLGPLFQWSRTLRSGLKLSS